MDISFTVCVLVCLFVRLRISSPRITASNFTRWFVGILDRQSHILGNFALQEASPPRKSEMGRIGHRADPRAVRLACVLARGTRGQRAGRFVQRAGHTYRIGMCGYTCVPKDGRTCVSLFFVPWRALTMLIG